MSVQINERADGEAGEDRSYTDSQGLPTKYLCASEQLPSRETGQTPPEPSVQGEIHQTWDIMSY